MDLNLENIMWQLDHIGVRHQKERSEAKQLPSTFWVDHGIQELKHYNFFRYRNSDFFFARFVILTESTTDAQVIEKLLNQSPTNKLYYV